MSLTKTFRIWEGYLVIRAEGVFLERFLNICSVRGLDIRNIRRPGGERLVAEISVSSFFRLRQVCRRTGTRVRIVKRCGLPFLLHRYRKRKIALLGVAAALLLLWYTSNHIMGITVFGNQRISTETVLEELEETGVALGKSARNLDSSVIRNQLMRRLDDLAWIGINVNGSRVYVEVVERLEKEEGVAMDQPCHLIAMRDGRVLGVEAGNGQTMVKVGAGVRQGDVLVSGIMDNPMVGYRLVHAYGKVWAETTYRAETEVPLVYQDWEESGRMRTRVSLRILDRTIPLTPQKSPYSHYATEEETKEMRLPVDLFPSLFFCKTTYREQFPKERERTATQALETAKAVLEEELQKEIPAAAEELSREVEDTLTERGTLQVTMKVTCRENIAKEEPIENHSAEIPSAE